MAGIYIHIPFCKQACHYCDFHFSTSLKKKEALISCLVKELELRKPEFKNETVETIYFGGGTPSLLSTQEITFLLEAVYKNYKVKDNPEITLEANPDDLTKEKIIALNSTPINRLSIGVQSFFENDLKLMNRAHNAQEANKCLKDATRYFNNISIDLIYGIPGLTNANWIANIEKVLSFHVAHISCYALTVEPKTALETQIKKGLVEPLNDDVAQEQFSILTNLLEKAGFVNYELSNFGKPGAFSKNNSGYWLGALYMGIGPSAHSFNGDSRSWNVSNNAKYIKSITNGKLPCEVEHLSKTDKFNECIMTGLRTIWGVSLIKVQSHFGENFKRYLLEQAKNFIDQKLLHIENDTLFITEKGKFLSDGIASKLFKTD